MNVISADMMDGLTDATVPAAEFTDELGDEAMDRLQVRYLCGSISGFSSGDGDAAR